METIDATKDYGRRWLKEVAKKNKKSEARRLIWDKFLSQLVFFMIAFTLIHILVRRYFQG